MTKNKKSQIIGISPPNDWMGDKLRDRLTVKPETPKPLGNNNFDPPKPQPAVAMAITNDCQIHDRVVNPRTMEEL